MITERKESMSPDGFLRLLRQEDGDIILCVAEGEVNGGLGVIASVEFCTPFCGGGGSSKTWAALVQLMGAMAEDNLNSIESGRAGEYMDLEEQKRIAEWAKQCRDAKTEQFA